MEKIFIKAKTYNKMSFDDLIELLQDYVITYEEAKKMIIDYINENDFETAKTCMDDLNSADYFVKCSHKEYQCGLIPLTNKNDIEENFIDVDDYLKVIEII